MKRVLLTSAALIMLPLAAFAQDVPTAMARFIDAAGRDIGSATLTQTGDTVTITGELNGIATGNHGFHFHETGTCDSSVAFASAGAHFNPTTHQHGSENPEGPHAGDLANVTAGGDTQVSLDLQTDMLSLTEGDPAYVFDADGTALVLHADMDDLKTDPSGNSGDRIACAVIEANPAS